MRRAWAASIVLALLALLAGVALAAPVIEKATKGERCVEDPADMRRNHMRFLEHQRDATVHGGIRGARHSLRGCIDCHASTKTGSVAAARTDFCAACHIYAAVKVDCFECHNSRPAAVAASASGPRP